MKKILVTAFAAIALLSTAACERAVSNVQVLISDDCGQNWTQIESGKVVPARVTACQLKVTIPDFPMSGEANFRTAFDNRVLVNTNIGYEYQITDGKKFLREARYLGRQNSASDGVENSADKYESAENTIINRRIREVVSSTLIHQNIVTFDQAKVEDQMLDAINEKLAERGVQLLSMQFVVTPDEQTRQAMDVASARQVYQSVGITDVGDKLLVARAGVSRIIIGSDPDTK